VQQARHRDGDAHRKGAALLQADPARCGQHRHGPQQQDQADPGQHRRRKPVAEDRIGSRRHEEHQGGHHLGIPAAEEVHGEQGETGDEDSRAGQQANAHLGPSEDRVC
jgi:hypothetical protein